MLGWFKKKFRKNAPAPVEEPADKPLTTNTSFSEHDQDEKEPMSITEPVPGELAPETEPDTSVQETAVQDEPVTTPEQESTAAIVKQDTIADEAAVVEKTLEKETTDVSPSDDKLQRVQDFETIPEPTPEPEPEAVVKAALAITKTEKIHDEEPPVPSEKKEQHQVPAEEKKEKKSLFSRLSDKLTKTRDTFTYQLDALFLGKKVIDEDMLDNLEELLITADLGVSTTHELLEYARREVKRKELSDPESLKKILKKRITKLILDNEADATLVMPEKGPFVIMVIGVNGVGKTTTIGKIANKFKKSGQSVMLVAGDTFRAAAVSQLKIWGERNNVPVVAHKDGSDPSAVVFDALGIAVAQETDVVLVDTAGRLHTQENLMEELKKIKRVMHKKLPGAPHETLLVIDATTGQNGISQARLFDAAVDITGLALTKLDGTSKGGIVANICKEMKIPIRFIGIGEQMDDLRDFDASEFAEALFQSRYGKHNQ